MPWKILLEIKIWTNSQRLIIFVDDYIMMLRVVTDFHSVGDSPSHAKTIVKASGGFGCWYSANFVKGIAFNGGDK